MGDFVSTEVGEKNPVSLAGAEGIHQDDSLFGMVFLMSRKNIAGGAETRLFHVECASGPYGIDGGVKGLTQEESDLQVKEREQFMIDSFTMTEPCEAIFFNDAEIKPEVRFKLQRHDTFRLGQRQTMLAFVRRPADDNWFRTDRAVSYAEAAEEFQQCGNMKKFFGDTEDDFEKLNDQYNEVTGKTPLNN